MRMTIERKDRREQMAGGSGSWAGRRSGHIQAPLNQAETKRVRARCRLGRGPTLLAVKSTGWRRRAEIALQGV